MPELFDLAAAAAAGTPHGQLVSAWSGDGLALSGHKLVEEGARALLLYVPGLLRVDVKPLEDGLQVVPRPLGGAELGWEIDPSAVTDYGKTAAETVLPALVAFRIALMRGSMAVAGRLLLSYTRAYEHGRTHFVGHVVLQQVDREGELS
jgi:hypothetical protein